MARDFEILFGGDGAVGGRLYGIKKCTVIRGQSLHVVREWVQGIGSWEHGRGRWRCDVGLGGPVVNFEVALQGQQKTRGGNWERREGYSSVESIEDARDRGTTLVRLYG